LHDGTDSIYFTTSIGELPTILSNQLPPQSIYKPRLVNGDPGAVHSDAPFF